MSRAPYYYVGYLILIVIAALTGCQEGTQESEQEAVPFDSLAIEDATQDSAAVISITDVSQTPDEPETIGPDSVVSLFCASWRDGDYSTMINLCPVLDEEYGHMTSSEIAEVLPSIPELVWEVAGVEYSVNGEYATVETLMIPIGDTLMWHCELVGDEWLIDGPPECPSADNMYACRDNMLRIYFSEAYYIGKYGCSGHPWDLMMEGLIEEENMVCPCEGDYVYTLTEDGIDITCPNGHGSIIDGQGSWD